MLNNTNVNEFLPKELKSALFNNMQSDLRSLRMRNFSTLAQEETSGLKKY